MSDISGKRLTEFVNQLRRLLTDNYLEIVGEKPINYGHQCSISDGENTIPVNIYYSDKKGLSKIVGGSERNPLKKKIQALIDRMETTTKQQPKYPSLKERYDKKRSDQPVIHNWESWIGTDEAGKGDFFGALVIAGFYVDSKIVPTLKEFKIQDSKKIKQKEIYQIAHKLYRDFSDRISVVSLEPVTYNRLYGEFSNDGKKLNELMSWAHGRVILDLAGKWDEKNVLVDQFTKTTKLTAALKGLKDLNLTQRTRAESDIAVATASVLARYHYLLSLEKLEKRYKIDFKSGSGHQSISTGVEFVEANSLEELHKVAKTHFINYQKIQIASSKQRS